VNEQDQGNIGGSISRQPSVQSEEKGSGDFIRNGFQIFSFSPKTIISWGMLSGLIGLFAASVSFYKRTGSEIDERISNHRELNRKLDKHEFEIENIKEDSKELGSRLTDVERYLNTRGKK
jgi:hypothetical protein